MDESDLEKYAHALRETLAERRAMWSVLVDLLADRFRDDFGDRHLSEMHSRIIAQLDEKSDDAERKNLTANLERIKSATDRLFSDVRVCIAARR
jgi:hypothetical protein